MKPIREFINNLQKLDIRYCMDILDLLSELKKVGYYRMFCGYDSRSTIFYINGIEWCIQNYPRDFYAVAGILYFTNKDIAMLMKLSVE